MHSFAGVGVGIATEHAGELIEARFVVAQVLSSIDAEKAGLAAGTTRLADADDAILGALSSLDASLADAAVRLRSVDLGAPLDGIDLRSVAVLVVLPDSTAAPAAPMDAYLRLHLLSMRATAPRSLEMDGIFGVLPVLAWTDAGVVPAELLDEVRRDRLLRGDPSPLRVYSVDKFPAMLDYVRPSGVRIADASRVRLGAHVASGTTVMHEGFVNFDAGTLGACMVEGRISAGVVVGAETDIGGGASIMGTLSGGGKERITVGERCLIGANAGIGVSLGDDCVVEAGLYVTAGTKVELPDGAVVAARQLSGRPGLLFRRNSQSGRVEVLDHAGTSSWGGLNAAVHQNT